MGCDFDLLCVHLKVHGVVRFESAYGKFLCVEPDGKVVADRSWDNSWEHFHLECFPDQAGDDADAPPISNDASSEHDDVECGGGGDEATPVSPSSATSVRVRFALRTHHGQYLNLDEERGTVSASVQPVLWTTDEERGICHCEGAVTGAAPPPSSGRQVRVAIHVGALTALLR